MHDERLNIRDKNIKKVSVLGVCTNIFLLIIKGMIGFLSNSQAMIADSLNSAGDIFASLMSFIGAKLSSKPCDKDHPYGHGKAEYVFSFVISISMILASIFMIKTSVESIVFKSKVNFSWMLLVTCIITICIKSILFIYTNKKQKETNSILIKASSEDHRNDVFVTTATLIGIVSTYFGFYIVDGIIGILISLWIIFVGIKLLRESYGVLIDTSLDSERYNDIVKIVEENDDIMHVDEILSKPVGNRHVIILKVSMDGSISLDVAHNTAGKIKEELIDKFDYICDVIIHINPHTI